jgi:hypothetical protein
MIPSSGDLAGKDAVMGYTPADTLLGRMSEFSKNSGGTGKNQ